MAEQARLTQNLEVVEANVRMLNQIMEDTAVPGTEDARDRALLDKGRCQFLFRKKIV